MVHHDGDYTRMYATHRRDYCSRFELKTGLNQFYIVQSRSHYETRTIRSTVPGFRLQICCVLPDRAEFSMGFAHRPSYLAVDPVTSSDFCRTLTKVCPKQFPFFFWFRVIRDMELGKKNRSNEGNEKRKVSRTHVKVYKSRSLLRGNYRYNVINLAIISLRGSHVHAYFWI